MKNSVFSALLAICFCMGCKAQTNNADLLKEATDKLATGSANVSTILTDKKYLPIHPETSFRALIKQNASANVLKIATTDEPGKKIKVMCTVKDEAGLPVSGFLVYLYQTDSRGWYAADNPHVGGNEGDMRHARLFGYVKIDEKGQFELQTVKPSGYPKSDLPAHIHIHFEAAGCQPYVTELLFDDDERLIGKIREQAIQSGFHIAKPEKTTGPDEQQFSYTVTLHKL